MTSALTPPSASKVRTLSWRKRCWPARDGGYDVVLDYLWGRPTEALVAALTGHDVTAESRRTRLIQIGEMAGPIIKLPAAALRSSGLEVMGSGEHPAGS